MTDSKQIEKALFDAACELDEPAVRAAFLDQACNGNAPLRDRLEKLLAVHLSAEEFFSVNPVQSAGVTATPDAAASVTNQIAPAGDNPLEAANTTIGRYRLQQRLGEGGCGVVYLAEQEQPLRRKVALKIIRLGMDTESVIARFEAERQALALMDHPNIAHVLDAGATDSGRPYFVMELVHGVKITDYCNQNHLDTRQRLDLFIRVCHAIQHAHQKGIIHRDIKPSNILVPLHDGMPMPKVIDFGIAKATAGRLADNTIFTACDQFIGTPAYMSPEQAEQSGLDVDTRSDIYSLGVLLYELLTGRTPFDSKQLMESGMDEMRRTLREREPQPPSTMLTSMGNTELATVAVQHHAEPLRLISSLSGDLDWIVMKALEKDRNRRYQTANALAMEVQRYLQNEPVFARPPSRFYRFQKLVRRNKTVFAAIGAVSVSLIAGLGVSTWLYLSEKEARQEQVRLRELADQARNNEAGLRREAEARSKITQAAILLSRNKFEEADTLVDKIDLPVAEPSLEATEVFRKLGEWDVTRGRWRQAADRFLKLIQANQIDKTDMTDAATRELLNVGPALIMTGDEAEYRQFIAATIARFAGSKNPVAAEQVIKASTILPIDQQVVALLQPLAEVAESSFATAPPNTAKGGYIFAWRAFALARFEYRRGNYANALSWGQVSLSFSDNRPTCMAMTHAVTAMAYIKLNQPGQARTELASARAVMDAKFPQGVDKGLTATTDESGLWHDWIELHLLLREATAMIGEPQ